MSLQYLNRTADISRLLYVERIRVLLLTILRMIAIYVPCYEVSVADVRLTVQSTPNSSYFPSMQVA